MIHRQQDIPTIEYLYEIQGLQSTSDNRPSWFDSFPNFPTLGADRLESLRRWGWDVGRYLKLCPENKWLHEDVVMAYLKRLAALHGLTNKEKSCVFTKFREGFQRASFPPFGLQNVFGLVREHERIHGEIPTPEWIKKRNPGYARTYAAIVFSGIPDGKVQLASSLGADAYRAVFGEKWSSSQLENTLKRCAYYGFIQKLPSKEVRVPQQRNRRPPDFYIWHPEKLLTAEQQLIDYACSKGYETSLEYRERIREAMPWKY